MNLIARRYQSVATLAVLLVAAAPMIFTGCGGGIISADAPQSSGPSILSVAPISGPEKGGIKVLIGGANFNFGTQQDAPAISFGGQPATHVRVLSATQVACMAPAHAAGHVPVQVTNSDGKSASSANDFTYTTTSLAVSSVTPNSGPPAGGTSVTVTGSGFASGATVSFGGTAASGVSVVSPTQISATSPAHAAGAVDVSVTNPDGSQGSLPAGFTYSASSAVNVSSVAPNSGSTSGGTTVVIAGTGFVNGATVSFGSAAASGVSIVSATQISATTPAHAAGAVAVTVANPDGSHNSLAGAFTYSTSSAVNVSSVAPNSGSTAGGTSVIVTGSGFASGAKVSFGSAAASGVSVVSATQIGATAPAHAAGAVAVTVTNPDGSQSSLPGGFTYSTSSAVNVSSVTPNSGPTAGGTSVIVTGSGFASGATVSFGSVAGSAVSVLSATQVKATVPAHAAGAVAVAIVNPDGSQGSLAAGFTYGSTNLTIANVSPISGPAAGGTKVTLTGTNFQSGASVSFGGLAASSITVSNSTTIVATTPAHSSGSVAVTVTNTDGTTTTLDTGYAFHTVDLNWSAPSSSSSTVSGYNVYRAPASSGPFTVLNGSSPVTGTSYGDTAVQGSTTYYYEVKSVDSNGVESAPAGPVQVTTGP